MDTQHVFAVRCTPRASHHQEERHETPDNRHYTAEAIARTKLALQEAQRLIDEACALHTACRHTIESSRTLLEKASVGATPSTKTYCIKLNHY